MKTKDIKRDIEKHIKAISKHRDALRNLIDIADTISTDCGEAIASLESAVDTLSQNL